LSTKVNLRFQQHQLRSIWFIVATSLALISVLNYFLARGFLAPIRCLIKGAMQIAKGDYTTRVPESRRDELGELSSNFNAMTTMLQSNESMRRQLMADVSHELRTPLAVLSTELENMEDGIQALNFESVRSLREEVNALTRRVDDIHQISLAEAGALQYHWQPLDLATWLEEEWGRWQSRLTAKGMTMEIQTCAGLLVRADPDRLRQLLRNLIENARNHARGATLLRILLHRESDQAVIEVHDNGQGVDEKSLPRLFERFWREDPSRSRKTGGSGLGLAICHSIVEAHGGRIDAVRSCPGGLCVRTCLPLIEARA
jgi:two-component system sensor histidine kinase BaeS